MSQTTLNLRGSTRKARRERSRALYLAGKSRGPYKLNRSVNESLTESSGDDLQPSTSESARVGTNSEIRLPFHTTDRMSLTVMTWQLWYVYMHML